MADCVHLRCRKHITCQLAPLGSGRVKEMQLCRWCGRAVVFVPADLMWIIAAGGERERVECTVSPTNRHEVNL